MAQRLVGIRIRRAKWANVGVDTSEGNDCLFVIEPCLPKASQDNNALAVVKFLANCRKLLRQRRGQAERGLVDLAAIFAYLV
jgi:hypothetical protein